MIGRSGYLGVVSVVSKESYKESWSIERFQISDMGFLATHRESVIRTKSKSAFVWSFDVIQPYFRACHCE